MKITVYSSRGCTRCRTLKRWLRRNKVPFLTENLDETEVMASLVMRNVFVLATPAIEMGDRVFLSDQIFDKNNRLNQEIKRLLKLTKKEREPEQ
ncbi:hypothetical protein ES707_20572 [subsurface metagenome]